MQPMVVLYLCGRFVYFDNLTIYINGLGFKIWDQIHIYSLSFFFVFCTRTSATPPHTPGEQSLSGPPNAVARMLTMMMTTVKQPMAALYLWQSAQSFFRQVIRSTSRMQEATTLTNILQLHSWRICSLTFLVQLNISTLSPEAKWRERAGQQEEPWQQKVLCMCRQKEMFRHMSTNVWSLKGRDRIPERFTDLQCVPQLVCICRQKGNVHQALDKMSFSPIFKLSWLLISPWSSSCSQSSFQDGRHLLLHYFQDPLSKPAIYQSQCLSHYLLQQLLSRFVMYIVWNSIPTGWGMRLSPFCSSAFAPILTRYIWKKDFWENC